MSISTVEEKEIPEHYENFGVTYVAGINSTLGATQIEVIAPGHHPKCRLVSCAVLGFAYDTSVMKCTIEDGDGNDASDEMNMGAVVNTRVAGTPISGQVFERNEAIVFLITGGNAANAGIITAQFESIH